MAFGLAFAAVGGLLLVLMFGPMVLGLIRSRNWAPTPCTIISSGVEESRSSKGGSTYRVAVRYRYQVDDRQYVGDRYHWMAGYSSGYLSKQRVVAALPPEAEATCFVNPANPAESVLNRDIGWEAAFILLPLAFIAFGTVFFYAGIRSYSRARAEAAELGFEWWQGRSSPSGRTDNGLAGMWRTPAQDREPRQLHSSRDLRMQVAVLAIAAALWNGILGIILCFGDVWPHSSDVIDILGAVFMIPFVLVGAGLIVGVAYSLLALRNPRPVVTIGKSILRLGDSVEIRWRICGRTDRISTLNLTLEGRKRTTGKHVFASLSIAHVSGQMEIANGRAVLHLPEQSMPSFSSPDNSVEWVLVVRGEIPHRPDMREEFAVDVWGPEATIAHDADSR